VHPGVLLSCAHSSAPNHCGWALVASPVARAPDRATAGPSVLYTVYCWGAHAMEAGQIHSGRCAGNLSVHGSYANSSGVQAARTTYSDAPRRTDSL